MLSFRPRQPQISAWPLAAARTAFVESHEEEGVSLLLDSAQFRPAVARDPPASPQLAGFADFEPLDWVQFVFDLRSTRRTDIKILAS